MNHGKKVVGMLPSKHVDMLKHSIVLGIVRSFKEYLPCKSQRHLHTLTIDTYIYAGAIRHAVNPYSQSDVAG